MLTLKEIVLLLSGNIIDPFLSLWAKFNEYVKDSSSNNFVVEIQDTSISKRYAPPLADTSLKIGSVAVPVTESGSSPGILDTGTFYFDGAFDIECDFLLQSNPNTGYGGAIVSKQSSDYGFGLNYIFRINSLSDIYFERAIYGGGGYGGYNFTVPSLALNVWHHVKLSRNSSGVITLVLNGVLNESSYTDTEVVDTVTVPYRIGNCTAKFVVGGTIGLPQYNNLLFPGYLANLTVKKAGSTILDASFNGSLVDLTGKTLFIDGDVTRLDSLSHDGNNSLLTRNARTQVIGSAGNSKFSFPTTFTIKGWVYINGSVSDKWFFGNRTYFQDSATNHGFCLGLFNNSTFRSLRQTSDGGVLNDMPITSLTTGWHHIAVTRDVNSVIRYFADGVASATTVTFAGTIDFLGSDFEIGGAINSNMGYNFQSNIDDLIIKKGVCDYVADFTP